MVKKYRKKPVVIKAVKWTGNNLDELISFINNGFNVKDDNSIVIHTLEGDHQANIGDYIIEGIKGEFYPCKSDIFEQTYDEEE